MEYKIMETMYCVFGIAGFILAVGSVILSII